MNLDDAAHTLKDAAQALDYSGVPFFLTYGTALGAIREGNFLSHDGDIDLGVLAEDFVPRASVLAAALIDGGFEVRTLTEPFSKCWAVKCLKRGISIDIVAWMLRGGCRFNPNVSAQFIHSVKRESLEDLCAASLVDVAYLCPGESYLQETYGDDWQVPLEADWRHQCRVDIDADFDFDSYLPSESPSPRTTCAPMFEKVYEEHGHPFPVAFYAGAILGLAEKVWLGACRAAVLRPQGRTQCFAKIIASLFNSVAEIYGLKSFVLEDEIWILHPSAENEVRGLSSLQKNSPRWHRCRAGLLGVPAGKVDVNFHERKCAK